MFESIDFFGFMVIGIALALLLSYLDYKGWL